MIHKQYLRLVLFDIDGTLLSTDGVAKHAFIEALSTVFDVSSKSVSYDFAGKTDQQIYHEITELAGIHSEAALHQKNEVFDVFFTLLEQRLTADKIRILPGVRELLDALEQEDAATLALLTGNMLRGARIKLTPPDLLRYFAFGAFGSDAYHRHELPQIAKDRAYDKIGVLYRAKEIVIIGDTPHDIECGRHLNVRSIAVATGGYRYEELESYRPDYLFENLGDTEQILDAVFN